MGEDRDGVALDVWWICVWPRGSLVVVGLSGKDLRLGWSYGVFLLRVRGMGVGLGWAGLGLARFQARLGPSLF